MTSMPATKAASAALPTHGSLAPGGLLRSRLRRIPAFPLHSDYQTVCHDFPQAEQQSVFNHGPKGRLERQACYATIYTASPACQAFQSFVVGPTLSSVCPKVVTCRPSPRSCHTAEPGRGGRSLTPGSPSLNYVAVPSSSAAGGVPSPARLPSRQTDADALVVLFTVPHTRLLAHQRAWIFVSQDSPGQGGGVGFTPRCLH